MKKTTLKEQIENNKPNVEPHQPKKPLLPDSPSRKPNPGQKPLND